MEFNENKSIYLQIVNLIFKKILTKEWQPTERIPAVRELAVSLEVNPNTVMRTYQHLENMSIISVKRGTGYYLEEEAYHKVFHSMRNEYLETIFPQMFRAIALLNFTPDEIRNLYIDYLKNSENGNTHDN